MELDFKGRLDRLDTMIAQDRLIRYEWKNKDASGRELVCLLTALSPEAGKHSSAHYCPASVMPKWLAYLTPWMNDSCSKDGWRSMIVRYAAAARRWSVLSIDDWHRTEYTVRALIVKEAVKHTTDSEAISICNEIIDLCDRVAHGEYVSDAIFSASKKRAQKARSRADARVRERYDAASMHREGERDHLSTKLTAAARFWAAEAVRSAFSAASSAPSPNDPESIAMEAASYAFGADNIINGILSAIEDACFNAEQR